MLKFVNVWQLLLMRKVRPVFYESSVDAFAIEARSVHEHCLPVFVAKEIECGLGMSVARGLAWGYAAGMELLQRDARWRYVALPGDPLERLA